VYVRGWGEVMQQVTDMALEVHSAVLSVLLVILRVGNCFLQNTVQNFAVSDVLVYAGYTVRLCTANFFPADVKPYHCD
jgi:hypothetical protein